MRMFNSHEHCCTGNVDGRTYSMDNNKGIDALGFRRHRPCFESDRCVEKTAVACMLTDWTRTNFGILPSWRESNFQSWVEGFWLNGTAFEVGVRLIQFLWLKVTNLEIDSCSNDPNPGDIKALQEKTTAVIAVIGLFMI